MASIRIEGDQDNVSIQGEVKSVFVPPRLLTKLRNAMTEKIKAFSGLVVFGVD